ncbi:MAG TPA: ScpA family protein [Candidatus Paceibacterota bacterium]|nr:ScpA family protein [Candidatus Paceibacterota bacterium]
MSKFHIKNEKFEGPLDLLLDLIEKRKLLINEFSLAQITDDYIAHVQASPEQTMHARADFILVASTLLLIKSRSLLPELNLTTDEEESIEDLEKRLKLYKRIKELSEGIKRMYGATPLRFARDSKGVKVIFAPDKNTSVASVHKAILDVLQKVPKKAEPETKATLKKTVSIEEMIDSLTERVQKAVRMSFREFAGSKNVRNREEKVNVIVGFLALLEMVKQGIISANQEKTFDDISMESNEISVPRY